jgi:hypothetical protein
MAGGKDPLRSEVHSSSKLTQKIEDAWLFRWNQRIDESLTVLADLQHEAKWETLVPDHLADIPTRSLQEIYVEALLLKGSLLRAEGRLQKSSSWLRRVAQQNDQILETRGFRLLFELGIDHWAQEETAEAMEYFLLAERKARNKVEKSFAFFNLLLCLEAIDLPRESIEEKVTALAVDWNKSKEFSHLQEQWHAYQARKQFFFEMKLSARLKATGQELFFRSWVESLPYFDPNWKEKAQFDLKQSYVWQGAYRSRTLTGVWLPADLEYSRVGDAVDRLYLWTWWWMGDHPQIGTDKIIWTLESILRSLDIDSQGKIDLLLLRNAVSWIVLIEPALEERVRKIMSPLRKLSSPRFQILDIEFALCQRLVQRLNQGRQPALEKQFKKYPSFWRIFTEGMKVSKNSLLPRLQRRLRPFENEDLSQCQFVIDLSKREIRVIKSYQILRSEGLSKLFSLLHQHGRARFQEIAGSFEVTDPRKVYNLVVRARKLTSNTAIQVRGQEVIRGKGWPQIAILHQCVDFSDEVEQASSEKRSSLIESKAHFQAAKALLNKGFSRKELQKTLRVSKATACRMIEKWLKEDLLTSSGKAKAMKYQWNHLEKSSGKGLNKNEDENL